MTRELLIGRVACLYLHACVAPESDTTARFVVDRLSAEQTAAIARAILADPVLSEQFEIRLPRTQVGHLGLPEEILTDLRATYHRNEPTEKIAQLLVNVGDDEEQSLAALSRVGAPDLLGCPALWVAVAGADLPITEDQRRWWERALDAVQDLRFVSLDRFANYVLRTRTHIDEGGLPVLEALGASLPALLMPKRTGVFHEIPEKQRGRNAKWKAVFNNTNAKCACYLSKRKPDGTLLSESDLRGAFEKGLTNIPEAIHPLVTRFIEGDAGWTPVSAEMAECEWEDIKPLFDGLQRVKYNLAQATLDFYDESDPEGITLEERGYLERLRERRTTEPCDDDREFYDRHRDELREDRKLKSYWEKFVYGSPKESTDFLVGFMLALEAFDWDASRTPVRARTLRVSCDKRHRRDLKELNVDAGRYFTMRYRGIRALLGPNVEWEIGELFEYEEALKVWAKRKEEPSTSEKKGALQLKFTVELEVITLQGNTEKYASQFVWRFVPLWITSELPQDWARLAEHPFQECVADREATNNKGLTQSVDLRDVKSLVASYGHERGTLVSKYLKDRDLKIRWSANLATARQQALITEAVAAGLQERWGVFQDSYQAALVGVLDIGLGTVEAEEQAGAFAALLEAVCRDAPGDRNRNLLLKPLLQLGTIPVRGGRFTAIVAPWHPLRLASMSRKARRFAATVRSLLAAASDEPVDMRLFFRDKQEELAHAFSPEVTTVFDGDKPSLVALSDTVGDYTLHESPLIGGKGRDETNDNPAEGSQRVRELVERYLTLQPHERNNLSVVLYNCDSARLPTAVVSKLSSLSQGEDDARCQVILRHRDPKRLRQLYEQIVESSDEGSDAYVASETSRDFLARLRIGIMADQAPPPDPKDGRPVDIVFLQDVIARHADMRWFPVGAAPAEPLGLNPAQWSRRRPVNPRDMKSVVYLTCPVQTRDGSAFLAAIAAFEELEAKPGMQYLPARQLDFRDPQTARILDETHNLGAWVANYDELLDRRQLAEQGVQIIRYKQTSTTGRSLVISSTVPLGLLRSMVARRLQDLDLRLLDLQTYAATQLFINDANEVSGDIVLRAAKRGRSASEMMGLVLSRYLVRHELGLGAPVGWFFLDDYADWLGQKEQQIADLMALRPRVTEVGEKELLVVITEAKYIDAGSLAAKRKESVKQLVDTLRRIVGAVAPDAMRLDRDVWRSRLADLLVDGVRPGTNLWLDLPEWARAVREGTCRVVVRGYSHVFVHGPESEPIASGASPITQVDGVEALQETFSLEDVRALVRLYAESGDPTAAREAASGTGGYNLPWRRTGPEVPPAAITAKNVPTAVPGQTPPVPATTPPGAAVDTEPAQTVAENSGADWAYPEVARWVDAAPEAPQDGQDAQAWLPQIAATARVALQGFNLQGKLLTMALTPNSALLRFQGSGLLTVDQVLKRRSEFLTTHGLNVIGVQPESGAVVIGIARQKRQGVPLRSLWKRWSPDATSGNQSLLIGVRERDNDLLILSPGQDHAPHTLIAGSTGSGKSVLMQNIILGIVATNTPALARITLIDPKQGVDYFAFEGLPHLDGGIIDQQDEALSRIGALVQEMDARYVRFKANRVPNLTAYNKKVHPDERLPVLWLIHDEFAEWMMVDEYKTEVSSAVGRLGVKARAAGIHLVFAAQRPEANVMPMQLRANLGNRLILRVDSEGTSDIALGEKGAERLLGKGHLLAKLDGETGLIYAQVPFATPEEIGELVESIEHSAGMVTAGGGHGV